MVTTNKRNQINDRELGKYWETQFARLIIPFGFSSDSLTGGIVDDKVIWKPDGSEVYVQIRHKDPYFINKVIRHCYGYEKYRILKDVEIIKRANIQGIYVIHDYTHLGRESHKNRLEDWYGQHFNYLHENVDYEQDGPTYYGDTYQIMPIYYWQVPKFKPLSELLNELSRGVLV